MKCRSKKILLSAFSLPEVAAALIILALVSSGVLVVINRCMVSASDLALRMQAFEVARENMEKLLASESVSEMAEFGNSDEYPQIEWQTTVETFYEPVTARMWIQAVCSAEYTDTAGDVQAVELTHWLTDLTKKQLLQIMAERQKEKEQLAEQDIETIEEAAEFAGVDEETIDEWVDNGMPTTEDGHYIKIYLDLYREHNGNPPAEAKEKALATYAAKKKEIKPQPETPDGPTPKPGQTPTPEPRISEPGLICGYTLAELFEMPRSQALEILRNCDEF